MSFEDVTHSSESTLSTWGEIPIGYDNVPELMPDDSAWCRTYVVDGDSFNIAIGDACVRRTGLVVVQVFTPTQIGSTQARQYADSISSLFINKRDNDIQYYVPYVTRVGYVDKIYQLNVSIPFQQDDLP